MSDEPIPAPIQLTDEQRQFIQAKYGEMDIHSLTRLVFNNPKLDGRSREGRALKEYLAGQNITIKTSKFVAVGPLELTPEQRKMIEDLGPTTESTVELARIVFKDPSIRNMSQEWRAVWKYFKEIYPTGFNVSEEPVTEMQYMPPATLQTLVGIVNSYVAQGDDRKKAYLWGRLRAGEERQLHKLMGFMRVFTFKYVASQYEKQVDRELFISTFIRWAHDKPDLTEIEVDQMINAAAERVNIAQIDRTIQRIDKLQEEIMNSGGEIDENGKKRRFGMTDVEMINGIRAKHDLAKARLEKLMATLEESRAERKDKIDQRSNSILNLFDAWMSDEQKRNDMLELGMAEHEEDAKEVGRIKSLDAMVALLSGQTEDEAANG